VVCFSPQFVHIITQVYGREREQDRDTVKKREWGRMMEKGRKIDEDREGGREREGEY